MICSEKIKETELCAHQKGEKVKVDCTPIKVHNVLLWKKKEQKII
jgi:hypothetical protein